MLGLPSYSSVPTCAATFHIKKIKRFCCDAMETIKNNVRVTDDTTAGIDSY